MDTESAALAHVVAAFMAEKESKKAVDYGPGSRSEHCAICAHFEGPQACELVRGLIDPAAWCKLFERDLAAA